jgi:hypothetical protein
MFQWFNDFKMNGVFVFLQKINGNTKFKTNGVFVFIPA